VTWNGLLTPPRPEPGGEVKPYLICTAPLPPIAAPATAPIGPATNAPAAAPVVARVAVFGPQAPTVSAKAQMRMAGSFGIGISFVLFRSSVIFEHSGADRYRCRLRRQGNPRHSPIRQS
jgi:hypothetical protein